MGEAIIARRGGGESLKFHDLLLESAELIGGIYAVVQDNTYVYCADSGTKKIYKIRKSDMEIVAESENIGGLFLQALTQDNDYIYSDGGSRKIYKIRKSDMETVAESSDYGGTIYAVTQDNDYIYCGGRSQKLWKIQKSNMVKIAETTYGDYTDSYIHAITQHGDYVYCGGDTDQRVWSINKSDMTRYSKGYDYGGTIYALTHDGEYLYCGGDGSSPKVCQLHMPGAGKRAESITYPSIIDSIDVDGAFVYCGGRNAKKVWKLNKLFRTYYTYKDLKLIPLEE